ncbi:MAG: hypothetical protein IAE82_07035 [Opitutaceae bacterium]|nr:hypothetical protein [Opitutaceae bacterium]
MPYTATVEDRIIHIAWEGVIAPDDLEGVDREIPRLAAELRFAPNVLHTFDQVTGRSFDPMAAFAVSQKRKYRRIPVPVRAALVVKSPEATRIAEVFVALNRTPNLTMERFPSEKAARAWLAE